jgi:hypothetical protein
VIYFGGNESYPLILAIGFRVGEGEGSLSDYKRIPKVECKKMRRRLRDIFLSKLEEEI